MDKAFIIVFYFLWNKSKKKHIRKRVTYIINKLKHNKVLQYYKLIQNNLNINYFRMLKQQGIKCIIINRTIHELFTYLWLWNFLSLWIKKNMILYFSKSCKNNKYRTCNVCLEQLTIFRFVISPELWLANQLLQFINIYLSYIIN